MNLTPVKIILYFLSKGYTFQACKFLVKQYQLETANGSSNLYLTNNNAFGMSCPMVRPTTMAYCSDLPDGNTNAGYKSIYQSIKDRYLWDIEFNIDKRSLMYGQEVSNFYHPSVGYFGTVSGVSDKVYRNSLLLILMLPIPLVMAFYYL